MSSPVRLEPEGLATPESLWAARSNNIHTYDPQVTEDLFLAEETVSNAPISDTPPVCVVPGEVHVGNATTRYKAFFSETGNAFGIEAPGFLGFLKSSEPLGRALAEIGIDNVVYEPIRRSDSAQEALRHSQRVHLHTQEAIIADLPHNPRIRREAPGGGKTIHLPKIVTTHSMAGISGTLLAELHANETELLVLQEAVACGGNVLKRLVTACLTGEMVGALEHEFIPYIMGDEIERSPKNVLRLLRYVGIGDPRKTRPSQTLGEMWSCLREDMLPHLTHIGELGVPRAYIEAEHDVLVRPTPKIAQYVDMVIRVPGGHLNPQHRAARSANAIRTAREELVHAA